MKTTIFISTFILLGLTHNMPNPAARYCIYMGYSYENRKDAAGNEYGVCIFPDGSECGDWQFFRGECGQEFSYCELMGCDLIIKPLTDDSQTYDYPFCSCTDSSGVIHDIPFTEYMEQNGVTLWYDLEARFDRKK